jgi:hypothetical protein
MYRTLAFMVLDELKELKALYHIQHRYDHNIWFSSWSIRRLYMGTKSVDLTRNLIETRELSENDITRLKCNLYVQGKAYSATDVDALQETNKVLEFLDKWINVPKINIVVIEQY